MNLNFAEGFPSSSRVWIYQCNRELTETEAKQIEEKLSSFAKQWTSHKQQISAVGKVLFNRFAILLADSTQVKVGGCSQDASFDFVREVEKEFGITLFDRLTMLFKKDNEIISIPFSELNEKFAEGVIDEQTIFFNNLVQTLSEMQTNWMVPVGQSWLISRLKETALKV